MRALINSKLLIDQAAQPGRKPFEIFDTRLSGFTLRVQPTGVRSFYARFGRNRRFALGKADVVDPEEARVNCQRILGNVAHGRHPLEGLSGVAGLTLGQFVQESYAPWVRANRPRTAANSLDKLQRHFGTWFAEPLSAITVERLELWKGVRRSRRARCIPQQHRSLHAPRPARPCARRVHVQHRRSLPGSPRCAHRKHPTRGPTASAAARKGRKARLCSLWPATARLLRDSSTKRGAVRDGAGSLLVFANASGEPLTRYGARYLLRRNAQRAARLAPSPKTKKLHPHSIPDSTAVALLNSGVALATISQWLGHAGLRAFD